MRLALDVKFENAEDDEAYAENGVPVTSKLLSMRVLNGGLSMKIAPAQGGCDQAERDRRGKLNRRFKKMNGHISITPAEGELLKKASHDALLPPFLHDQFCEWIDGAQPDEKPKE